MDHERIERIPPHDDDAEQATLGAMFLHRSAIGEATPLITGGSFYHPKHGQIFDAIVTLHARNEPADAITVARELERRGELSKIGGPLYLGTLMDSVPTAANAGWYAQIVREHAIRRRLVEVGTRIANMGYRTDDHADIDEIVNEAQALAMTIDHTEIDDEEDLTLAAPYFELIESIENGTKPGLRTGFRDLDELTHGLHPGQLIVIAARPGQGKSLMSENIGRYIASQQDKPVAMFTLEMSREEIVKRAISAEGRIPLHHLAHGHMTDADWQHLYERTGGIPAMQFHVDDDATHTIATIRTKARRLKVKHGIQLLIVDYVQLMDPEDKKGRGNGQRQQEVAAISRGLKLLAKELMIPVIGVAQLNRGPEQRADKKPVMSDLRDSGALEMDADVVILIHREAAYEPAGHPRAGEADLIVDKNRSGPKGTVTVAFQGHYARLTDMGRG